MEAEVQERRRDVNDTQNIQVMTLPIKKRINAEQVSIRKRGFIDK